MKTTEVKKNLTERDLLMVLLTQMEGLNDKIDKSEKEHKALNEKVDKLQTFVDSHQDVKPNVTLLMAFMQRHEGVYKFIPYIAIAISILSAIGNYLK